ncbi:Epoxide hydrolase [Metarhizium guizhouense ARSEF 977]|uniref:Epoxide hydrolase n=1 Tax=Metarhizium guizhouense (strain ARSEF 977) TaxID=1276136 RepID=A0A0B4H223_METGA|nr:Epoxide hydrolase [Metarhizium guizhouense ARSEF 977]
MLHHISLALAFSSHVSAYNDFHFGFNFHDIGYAPQGVNISVDPRIIRKTLQRVRDYRPVTGLFDDWTVEGPSKDNMTSVAKYWADEYCWEDAQQQINRDYKHYITKVPGSGNYTSDIPLHFLHHKSENDKSSEVSFHVVAPDLPGFGFSPAATQDGLGTREMGRAVDALMKQLGYSTYGLATTDTGWFIGMWMVHDVADSIIGHLFDFWYPNPNSTDIERFQANQTTAEETAVIESLHVWDDFHNAYSMVHSQKPIAMSLALADIPVGFLGWYWDLSYAISDGIPHSMDELITDALMLWLPGPYGNIRSYRQIFRPDIVDFPKTNVPSGVSQWGWGHGPFPASELDRTFVQRHLLQGS